MKTVSGLFDDYKDAETAVEALERSGVPSEQISIVSNNAHDHDKDHSGAANGAGTGAGLGAVVGVPPAWMGAVGRKANRSTYPA